MERKLEAELMDEEEQARAYAEADFAEPHNRYVELFAELFPLRPPKATVLDLGCGAADVTLRLAKANPGYIVHAVDGSAAMLRCGRMALKRDPEVGSRIRLIHGHLPGAPIPQKSYEVVFSTGFLHHLADPQVLWATVRRFSKRGTLIFVADLLRPRSRASAKSMVEEYASEEPAILKRDFLNSLLAAFTLEEVVAQLAEAGLSHLNAKVISDRHLMVHGRMGS